MRMTMIVAILRGGVASHSLYEPAIRRGQIKHLAWATVDVLERARVVKKEKRSIGALV